MDDHDLKKDFPILKRQINGKQLVYLDNAASSQKPRQVIDAISNFYKNDYANVHRSVSSLSSHATDEYEKARDNIAKFIGAKSSKTIIFTRSTTESINLVARSFGDLCIKSGDEILITASEHHSNLIPWQQLAKRKQAYLKYLPLKKDGSWSLKDLQNSLTDKTKIVALSQASNVLGTINPIKQAAALVHQKGGYLLVDGAQAVPHFKINVDDQDADFYAFSGHKMLGPSGIGVLYGKEDLLNRMDPIQYGGEMINVVDLYESSWGEIPLKFEAGTPNIVGAIGLSAAVDYLKNIGMNEISAREDALVQKAIEKLKEINGLEIYGPKNPEKHHSLISFNLKNIHPHDLASVLDLQGIEVRAGDHCAQPLMNFLGINGTVRASFAFYNDQDDIDSLIEAIKGAKSFFANGL